MAAELRATILQIHDCLKDACGESSAKSIEHFVPSSLAVYDPACFEDLLTQLVPTLSGRIINAIKTTLARDADIEVAASESLFACMMRINAKKGGMTAIIAR